MPHALKYGWLLHRSLFFRWLLLSLVALGVLGASTATAHAESAQDRWGSIGRVDAGWDGHIISGLAAPWRVQLLPGREPVAAIVEMRFVQDGSQQLSIKQRVALVPGQPASVQFTAGVPYGIREVAFSLSIEGGRTLDAIKATERYDDRPRPSTYRTTPAGVRRLTLVVGQGLAPELRAIPSSGKANAGTRSNQETGTDVESDPSADADSALKGAGDPTATTQEATARPGSVTVPAGGPATPAEDDENAGAQKQFRLGGRDDGSALIYSLTVNLSDLPVDSNAYEAVHLVIINQRSIEQMTTAQTAGLFDWLAGGGRVILIAPEPGAAWRKLLGPATVADPVVMGPPVEVTTSKAATPIYGRGAVAKALVRSARVTPLGQRAGWLELGQTTGTPSDAPPAPLMVCGPVGVGHLTVLLAAPETLTTAITQSEKTNAWRSLLSFLGTFSGNAAEQNTRAWRWDRSYSASLDTAADQLRSHALARMDVAEPRHALAWIVGAVLLLLGLQLGIIDPLLHRRHRRTRTYLFAALWIACASAVVIAALPLLGSLPSSTVRVDLVEQATTPLPGCRVDAIEASFAGESSRWKPRWPGIFAPLISGTAETQAQSASPWQTVYFSQSVPAGLGLATEQLDDVRMARGSLRFLRATGNAEPRLLATTVMAEPSIIPRSDPSGEAKPAIRLALLPGPWLGGRRPTDYGIASARIWIGENVCWEIADAHELEDGSWLLILGPQSDATATFSSLADVSTTDGLRTALLYNAANMATILLSVSLDSEKSAAKAQWDDAHGRPGRSIKSDPDGRQRPNQAPSNGPRHEPGAAPVRATDSHTIIARILISTEGWTPAMIDRLAQAPPSRDARSVNPVRAARTIQSQLRLQLGLPPVNPPQPQSGRNPKAGSNP